MAKKPIQAAIQRLESLNRAGVTHMKKAPKRMPPPPVAGVSPRSKPAKPQPPSAEKIAMPSKTTPADPRCAALAVVAREVAACTRCAELAQTRTQTVFGVGNPCARLVFCGEAPGADEDRLGEPFVGRAGQLLTDIIVKGMKIQREDVYILNILRCRPPGNRNPSPIEAANCREYLDRQLQIIQPEFICCLGAVAAQNLLGVETPIGQLRGRVHDFQGIKVVCTYHPAYLLRNPPAKKYVWDDIQMLMAEMKKTQK
jgi:DNA polymerase